MQNYSWGKIGNDSFLASCLKAVEPGKPYAELWFGAHEKGSSLVFVEDGTVILSRLIEQYPQEVLGTAIAKEFASTLPFLFKLLSIAKPLSIQAHPDKILAKGLHKADPKNYPDDNHKLELAVALSEVELLHGFRKKEEILFFINQRKAFAELISKAALSQFENADGLSTIFKELMRVDKARLERALVSLCAELKSLDKILPEDAWILRLEKEVGVDAGLFCFYLLNLIKLMPGQAIYTAAGTAHAYLSGDLAECMTNSDNVVRGGLTTKYKDVERFVEMLDYKPVSAVLPGSFSKFVCPGGEFQLELLNRGSFAREAKSAQVLFCLNGSSEVGYLGGSQKISAGESYLIPASLERYQLNVESGQVFISSVPERL